MNRDTPAPTLSLETTATPKLDAKVDLRTRCEAIFREHNDALVRTVYTRLQCWDEANEVVQEAFMRVFRLRDPPPISFLRAYLYKIALNLAYDRRVERQQRQECEERLYTEVYCPRERANPTPEELCLEEETRSILANAVEALPEKTRTAFTLVELECLTVKATARIMGVSDMAVYQLVHRAYGMMARSFTKRRLSRAAGSRSSLAPAGRVPRATVSRD